MGNLRLYAILLSQLLVSSAAIAAEYPVNLEYRQIGEKVRVIVHNMSPSPVSIRASLSQTSNVASDRSWPIYQAVQPHSSADLADLSAVDQTHGINFKTSLDSVPGLFDAAPDPQALYRLPFADGASYRVVQAPGGPVTTHTAPVNRFAVDFDMPEGAAVVAARDGLVIQTEDRFAQGGRNAGLADKANYVRILHADGTTAVYAHLMHKGVTVEPGQAVQAGALIGYSGSTGFSGGPHLHFAVTHIIKTADGFDDVSIPVSFYLGSPAHALELRKGMLVRADYQARDLASAAGYANVEAH